MAYPGAGPAGNSNASFSAVSWLALTGALAALGVAVAAAVVLSGRINQAAGQREDLQRKSAALESLEKKSAALEAANAELSASVKDLSGRLLAAEERCWKMETRLAEAEKVRQEAAAAAAAAREEAARRRAGDEAAEVQARKLRETAEKALGAIAEIQKKVEKNEMKPEEAREAIAGKVTEGLKEVLPPGAAEKMEQARAEREKALPEDQRRQAEQVRAAFLDGLGEMAAIQQQARDGKITQEEARRQIGEKMRARFEAFKNTLPEDQRKRLEELMKRRGGWGGGAPAPVPGADKEQF